MDSCLRGVKFWKLPKNMQHEALIIRGLGFSYLWIDSVCIIQNSMDDWETETAKMGDVYAGAVCAIASTGSSSSKGGYFHKRKTFGLPPSEIGSSPSRGPLPKWIYICRDDLFDFRRSVDRSPLNKSGWVLQERLLSHRILHFGAEILYWECCQQAASELNPTGYVY